MDSKTESQALAPTKPSLEGFVYDWYIRVWVHFFDIPSGNTRQTQAASYTDIESSIVQLCLRLNSSLKREDFQLWPRRLVDVKEEDKENDGDPTKYWILGLPILEKQELRNVRNIVKDWQESAQREGKVELEGKRRVKATLVPRKVILGQDLREDLETVQPPAPESSKLRVIEGVVKQRSKETFKKKAANPGDIRRQFMQHMLGSDSSSNPSVGPSAKLRPAKDVLKRLRYDPEYDEKDYVVGYINQKAGITEVGVGKLDERGPEGNIAYFKEVEGGRVVWDRVGKVDLIFGG